MVSLSESENFWLRQNLMVTVKRGGKRNVVTSDNKETERAKIESIRIVWAGFCAINQIQEPLKLLLIPPPETKSDFSSGSLPSLTKYCGHMCAKDRTKSWFESWLDGWQTGRKLGVRAWQKWRAGHHWAQAGSRQAVGMKKYQLSEQAEGSWILWFPQRFWTRGMNKMEMEVGGWNRTRKFPDFLVRLQPHGLGSGFKWN